MARRGQKKHLKRLPAPRHWPIKRKEGKFTTRVIPGPHSKEECVTLAILLREMLGYAETMREVKAILNSRQVLVDGRVRREPRFPVGVMDVIEIKSSGDIFRILPKMRGGLRLVPISPEEAKFKLCRIERKMMVPGGRVQMTTHDGRNLLLPDGHKPSEFHTLDTVKISIPDQEFIESYPLREGAYAIVTQGKNVGIEGRVIAVERRFGTHASTVTLEDPSGNQFQTALEYVFVVGAERPEVQLQPAAGGVTA